MKLQTNDPTLNALLKIKNEINIIFATSRTTDEYLALVDKLMTEEVKPLEEALGFSVRPNLRNDGSGEGSVEFGIMRDYKNEGKYFDAWITVYYYEKFGKEPEPEINWAALGSQTPETASLFAKIMNAAVSLAENNR
jgi:hypothetical protein